MGPLAVSKHAWRALGDMAWVRSIQARVQDAFRQKRPQIPIDIPSAKILSEGSSSESSIADDPRYHACPLLWKSGMPSIIWLEDALWSFGIPTGVFDVFLLVKDPELAAASLIVDGYSLTQPNPRFKGTSKRSKHAVRVSLLPSTASNGCDTTKELPVADDVDFPGVILLPASDWGYALPIRAMEQNTFFPELNVTLDCLMANWMEVDEDDYKNRSFLGCHIGYFYLYLETVREPGFEHGLRREHWQLHYDMLVENDDRAQLGSLPSHRRHKLIRDRIKAGIMDPIMAAKPLKRPISPH